MSDATPPPPDPDLLKVVLTKLPGKPWKLTFRGNVTQLHINHLTRLLRVEYARTKRRNRITKRKEQRNASTQGS